MPDTFTVTKFRVRAEPIVEAVQLLDDGTQDWEEIARWCGGKLLTYEVGDSGEYDSHIAVPGWALPVYEGDWIIKGITGLFFVRDAALFGDTYEVVPSDA